MSTYGKGRRFSLILLAATFAWPFVAMLLAPLFGNSVVFAVVAVLFAFGMTGLAVLRCPNCKTSIFASSKNVVATWTPWPRKVCGHCRLDLEAN